MPAESAFTPSQRGLLQTRPATLGIASLARRQHGVVTRGQLLEAGLHPNTVDLWIRNGRLHLIHAGAYALGHSALSREGRWVAAVLRAGRHAVLSHRSAAALWDVRGDDGIVDITIPTKSRSAEGIRRHFSRLAADEVTRRRGIAVTTVSRTLLDLSAVISDAELTRAIREAEVLRLPLRPPLAELLARHRGRRGIARLRRCLDALRGLPGGLSRSALEDRLLSLLKGAALPAPRTNSVIHVGDLRFEVDCCWTRERVIVELDGHRTHGTRAAFESDRERDRRLQAAGWTVVRVTWRQIHDDPAAVTRDLARLLEHAGTGRQSSARFGGPGSLRM